MVTLQIFEVYTTIQKFQILLVFWKDVSHVHQLCLIKNSIKSNFQYHSNMLIWCSRNISSYYNCLKQLRCFIFLWKLYSTDFSDEWKVQTNINAFTDTFDKCFASLLNYKFTNKKSYNHKTFNSSATYLFKNWCTLFILLFCCINMQFSEILHNTIILLLTPNWTN